MNKKHTLWMMARVPFASDNGLSLEIEARKKENIEIWKKLFDEEPVEILNFKHFNILEDMKKDKKNILEIGFGAGGLTKYFLDNAKCNYFGIEPYSEIYNFVKEKINDNRIRLFNETFENFNFEKKYFDYIVSYDVIEHVVDPLFFINKIRFLLKDDGKSVITCPNIDGLIPKISFYKKPWRQCFPTHRWLTGIKSLSKILEFSEMKIKKYITYGGFEKPRNLIKEVGNFLLKKTNLGDHVSMLIEKG